MILLLLFYVFVFYFYFLQNDVILMANHSNLSTYDVTIATTDYQILTTNSG